VGDPPALRLGEAALAGCSAPSTWSDTARTTVGGRVASAEAVAAVCPVFSVAAEVLRLARTGCTGRGVVLCRGVKSFCGEGVVGKDGCCGAGRASSVAIAVDAVVGRVTRMGAGVTEGDGAGFAPSPPARALKGTAGGRGGGTVEA